MKVYSDETIRQSLVTANSKQQLHQWHQQIKTYLEQLRLKIHPRKANLFVVKRGVDILGYRVFPHYRLLRNDNGHRFTRKLRRFARLYAQGKMEYEDFNPSWSCGSGGY